MLFVYNIFPKLCFLLYLLVLIVPPSKSSIQRQSNINKTVITDVTRLSWEVWCKLQPNGYNCGDLGTVSRFYYDLKLEDCRTADVSVYCRHNINVFDTISDCHDACKEYGDHLIEDEISAAVYCRLQPDFGNCNSYYPRFYFDMTRRQCRGFSYSGCGGNPNRFPTFQVCSAVCMPLIEYQIDVDTKVE